MPVEAPYNRLSLRMTHFINATVFTGDDWLTGASVSTANGWIQTVATVLGGCFFLY